MYAPVSQQPSVVDDESDRNQCEPHDARSALQQPSDGSGDEATEEKQQLKREVKWQPFWLRPMALGSFSGLFLCLTVALPCILYYSQRELGLFEARQQFAYSWRFTPTASKSPTTAVSYAVKGTDLTSHLSSSHTHLYPLGTS